MNNVALTTDTILYLGTIIERIAAEQYIEQEKRISYPTFHLSVKAIKKGIRTYITSLIEDYNTCFSPYGFTFSLDPQLDHILSKLEKKQPEIGAHEVLRLLGICGNRPIIGPQTIHLDLTNSCNTDCIYCWWHSTYSENRKDPNYGKWFAKHLDGKTIEGILTDAEEMDVQEILLTGQGEPLTHPDIDSILQLLSKKSFHTTIFTNGKSLTEQKRQLIAKAKLDIVYISFSAATYETHKKIHPTITPPEFEQIRENIQKTRQLLSEQSPDTVILFCFVINKLNFDECLSFLDLAHTLGLDYVRFQMMDPVPGTKSLLITDEQRSKLPDLLSQLKERAESYGIEITDNIDIQEEHLTTEGNWNDDSEKRTCYAGWYFARPWTNYGLSFCCADKMIDSLDDKSFKEIWFSETYTKARLIAKQFDEKQNYVCSNNKKLLDHVCLTCGNYEYNEKARRLLKTLEE